MSFLPISGYEDYLINKNGVVKSLPKKLWNGSGYFISKETILKHSITNGYFTVALTKNKKTKNIYLHRLIAMTFIPNPDNKNYINHKDGNKLNNSLKNIEWCTASENNKHAFKIGLRLKISRYGEDNYFCHFSKDIVNKVREKKGEILRVIADEFNMSISHVWAIQNYKTRIGEIYA